MPMDRKTTVIDGVRYEVATLNAWDALPVFDKVAKVLVPTFNSLSSSGAAIATLTKGASVSELAVLGKLATGAAEAAVRNMNPTDLRYCIDAFAATTDVTQPGSSKSPKLTQVFADLFAGNLVAMWKWFYFCLQVNFGDFSDLAQGMLRSAREQKSESSVESVVTATSASPSPAASTPASSG